MKLLSLFFFYFFFTYSQNPNIILIIGDDHGYNDIGLINKKSKLSHSQNTVPITASLNKLAKKGIYYRQAYASSPICSPSRYGIMTGSYHQRNKIFWYGGKGLDGIKNKTISEILKKKGYKTLYVGKYHYGLLDNQLSKKSFPLNHSFDLFFGAPKGRKHYLIHNDDEEKNFFKLRKSHKRIRGSQSLEMTSFWSNRNRHAMKGFSTEIYTDTSKKFINISLAENKNFFLTLSFNAVHNFTHQLPKKYLKEKKLPELGDWNPSKESYRDWYLKGRVPNNKYGRQYYLGQLHYMDKAIGNLIQYLKKKQLDKNTIIIYIGDNGGSTPIYADNFPLRGSKYTVYEGGVRVPFIVSIPDSVIKNSRLSQLKKNEIINQKNKINNDQIVSTLDIAPTITELLQITNQVYRFDGNSIFDDKNNKKSKDRFLVWDAKNKLSARYKNWKYISYKPSAMKTARFEGVEIEIGEFLYDLNQDISEEKNLIKKYPNIAKEIKNKIKNWHNKTVGKSLYQNNY